MVDNFFQEKNSSFYAPAKLIISGEHAILYGQPAIAIPLNFGVKANVCFHSEIGINIRAIDHKNTQTNYSYQPSDILNTFQRVINNHHQSLASQTKKTVLEEPMDLVMCAIHLSTLNNPTIRNKGIEICYHSLINPGSGLGSSSAVSSAIIGLLNPLITEQKHHQLVCQNEDFAHGKSGRLDPWISVYQQPVYWHKGKVKPMLIHMPKHYLIDTGKPNDTTADCVFQVQSRFAHNKKLWQSMGETSKTIAQFLIKNSLTQQDLLSLYDAIKCNHQQLYRIGVVPDKVACFINRVEQLGYAAKITGAGAISGDSGGVIIVFANTLDPIRALISEYGYEIISNTEKEI